MEVMELELVKEPKTGIALAAFSLKYELEDSFGDFEYDRRVVENHFNIIAKLLSEQLTNEIGAEIFIGNIEYSEGSVEVNGYVLGAYTFVTSIISGYIVTQLPDIITDDEAVISTLEESQKNFKQVCEQIENVTNITIEGYEKDNSLKNSKITITTKKIETVCEEWIVQRNY